MSREIDSPEALNAALNAGTLRDHCVQGVDCQNLEARLSDGAVDVDGAVFIGCTLSKATAMALLDRGAVIVPRLGGLPFEAGRPHLYTVDELMAGYSRGNHRSFFSASKDAAIYDYFVRHKARPPLVAALAMRLHDLAMDDAVDEVLHPGVGPTPKVVAFMGGHAMKRTDPLFVDVARCAHALAKAGYFIVTGGGPGAMEAANLGAYARDVDDDVLHAMIADLAPAPGYRDDGFFDTALQARERVAAPAETLGVPTWFYGHEPTNLFCTKVAKYFSNALREDGLLTMARHGIVFAPGGPGTMQEVFQDACQNAYGTGGDVSPMVFFGQRYWTTERPALPLLRAMVGGLQLDERVAAFDDVDAIIAFLGAHPPVPYQKPGGH